MKSLVVMTYYQLMHAIALALTFEEKPFLFFCMEFLNPDESLLERIDETGVFAGVKGITRRGEFTPIIKELRKTKNASASEIDKLGNKIFDSYLESLYASEMKEADPKEEIFVYNDFQWHYYYICKHFKNIVGVEDGYCSLRQQIGIHVYKGDRELLEPFIKRGFFPKPLYREESVQKIISSCDFDDIDDYYKSKLVVWDYKDIVAQNEEAFKKAVLYIFEMEDVAIVDNSTLCVGQPLDRSKYCTALQNYLLTRKIVQNEVEKAQTVYFKPHPADRNSPHVYDGKNIVVLPQGFPVEVFNYYDRKFDRLVTFGSTASSLVTCSNEVVRVFDKAGFNRDEVSGFIENVIKCEKIVIDIYLLVRKLTPEAFISAYSCVFRDAYYKTRIHVVLDASLDYDEALRFFDISNTSRMINSFKQINQGSKEKDLWLRELNWLNKWVTEYDIQLDCHQVSSLDDWAVFKEVVCNCPGFDYFMILGSGNVGFQFTEEIIAAFKQRMYLGIFFQQYSVVIDNKNKALKISLNPGYLGSYYSGELVNKLFHRGLFEGFEYGGSSEHKLASLLHGSDEYIRKQIKMALNVDSSRYEGIDDGQSYYRAKIRNIIADPSVDNDCQFGGVANVVYEYHNWYSVRNSNALAISISEATDELIDDEEVKSGVYKVFADAFLREKVLVDNLPIMQESNYYYQKVRPIVDRAAKHGVIKGLDYARLVRKKIRQIKRKLS